LTSPSPQTSPPVSPHDAPHRRQPDAVPGKSFALCRRWNTPNRRSAKRMSKPAPLSRTREAPALVGRGRTRSARRALAGVLPRVAEQVLQHDAQQRRVALRLQAGSIDRARVRSGAWRRRSSAT
jgi:hypothetical protein